jgi:hypothetical protein
MRTTVIQRAVLAAMVAVLAADPHTVVVGGTYTCGPLDLDVVGGGAPST